MKYTDDISRWHSRYDLHSWGSEKRSQAWKLMFLKKLIWTSLKVDLLIQKYHTFLLKNAFRESDNLSSIKLQNWAPN